MHGERTPRPVNDGFGGIRFTAPSYVSMLLNSDNIDGAGSANADSLGATYPGRWYDVSGSGSTNCSPQTIARVS